MPGSRLAIILGCFILFFLTSVRTFAAEASGPVATPSIGSPERKLILDALRTAIKEYHHLDVVFVVTHLKVKGGWAWVDARPQSANGKNQYEDVSALLRKRGSKWEVAELACAEEDNDLCLTNPDYFKLLEQRFPGLTKEILPHDHQP